MRMVAPRTGAPEMTVAEEQGKYQPITVASYDMGGESRALLTRWRLTDEECVALMTGTDLYVIQLGAKDAPMTPLRVQVGPEGWEG